MSDVRCCPKLYRRRADVLWQRRAGNDLAAGNLLAEHVHAGDWMRIAELVARYRDLPLGTADASVIAAAERLAIPNIATLDRRHFTVVQSTLGDLRLLP